MIYPIVNVYIISAFIPSSLLFISIHTTHIKSFIHPLLYHHSIHYDTASSDFCLHSHAASPVMLLCIHTSKPKYKYIRIIKDSDKANVIRNHGLHTECVTQIVIITLIEKN